MLTEVWVPGLPKTKGSLTFHGGNYVEENVKGSQRWRLLVADAVRRERRKRLGGLAGVPSAAPVAVRALFWLPPVASPKLAETYAPIHTHAGDVDKLARNVLDALGANAAVAAKNGGAYIDDNQVCDLHAVKMLASDGMPGMLLLVNEILPTSFALDETHWCSVRRLVEQKAALRG